MTTSGPGPIHPSCLALDRASLGEASAEVLAHLEACASCRAYVASLADGALSADFSEVHRRIVQSRAKRVRALGVIFPLAAAACGLLFFGLPHKSVSTSERSAYVGSKGFPSVWIYVKHGGETALWDGKKPVFAGDRLRLKVDPGRFRRVAVYSVKAGDGPELLYESDVIPGQSTTLSDAWEVDEKPGAERLLVALSDAAIQPVWPDWLDGKATNGATVLNFTLSKSASTDVDAGSVP